MIQSKEGNSKNNSIEKIPVTKTCRTGNKTKTAPKNPFKEHCCGHTDTFTDTPQADLCIQTQTSFEHNSLCIKTTLCKERQGKYIRFLTVVYQSVFHHLLWKHEEIRLIPVSRLLQANSAAVFNTEPQLCTQSAQVSTACFP